MIDVRTFHQCSGQRRKKKQRRVVRRSAHSDDRIRGVAQSVDHRCRCCPPDCHLDCIQTLTYKIRSSDRFRFLIIHFSLYSFIFFFGLLSQQRKKKTETIFLFLRIIITVSSVFFYYYEQFSNVFASVFLNLMKQLVVV